MKFNALIQKVNESTKQLQLPAEVFEYVDELASKNHSEKDIRAKLKKKFPKISNEDIDILVKVS